MIYIYWCQYVSLVLLASNLVACENIGLRKHLQRRLQVIYKSLTALSAIHCNAVCRREASCRTTNHNQGTGECQFSEICHSDVEGNMVTDTNWEVYALNDNTQFGCNYNGVTGHNLATGSIVSPLYPGAYPMSTSCSWLITAPSGYHVTLTFWNMDMETNSVCGYDSLKVYDGLNEGYPLLGVYCGTDVPSVRSCTGTSMFVKFLSDGSVQGMGFKATWNFVPAFSCGCNYHNIDGGIASPNYPSTYNPNQVCEWVLTSGAGGAFTFTINDFELEVEATCNFDYLEIRAGTNEYGSLIGSFCSLGIPWTISGHNSLFLRFKTDHSVELRGFSASWTITH